MRAKSNQKSPAEIINDCSLCGICGGCFFAGEKYSAQLEAKNKRVKDLLDEAALWRYKNFSNISTEPYKNNGGASLETYKNVVNGSSEPYENSGETPAEPYEYLGIVESPLIFGYRNKMEYSFGDCAKDGELTLGLHKKKSFYDVIDVDCCMLVHDDCNKITAAVADYFKKSGVTYKDKRSHKGYLRYLIIRRAINTGETLIDLVTTSQRPIKVMRHSDIYAADLINADGSLNVAYGAEYVDESELIDGFKSVVLRLMESGELEGSIRGILHTVNDSKADAVKNEGTKLLYGEDHITEELLGLSFDITPFSFFQTNSKGAEALYSQARNFIKDKLNDDMTVYDLYTGTGTIAQILAPCVKKVVGVEIVEEAVEAAKTNAAKNGLTNCSFIADDVIKALDVLPAPDLIVLDPPRDGVNPKALKKLCDYNVENILYISCKPESLARDLKFMAGAGYRLIKAVAVDQFPWTNNIETVCQLVLRKPVVHVNIDVFFKEGGH